VGYRVSVNATAAHRYNSTWRGWRCALYQVLLYWLLWQ